MSNTTSLIQALAGEQAERVAAATELRRCPGLYLDALKRGLKHKSPEIRHGCYWVLASIDAPGSFLMLSQGLTDPELKIQSLAKQLLRKKLADTQQQLELLMGTRRLNDLRVRVGLLPVLEQQTDSELSSASH